MSACEGEHDRRLSENRKVRKSLGWDQVTCRTWAGGLRRRRGRRLRRRGPRPARSHPVTACWSGARDRQRQQPRFPPARDRAPAPSGGPGERAPLLAQV